MKKVRASILHVRISSDVGLELPDARVSTIMTMNVKPHLPVLYVVHCSIQLSFESHTFHVWRRPDEDRSNWLKH